MRITNLNLLLLVASMFIPLTMLGQTNFLPGYYVTHKSDTVHCLIEYRSPEKMRNVIRFKHTSGDRAIELKPEDVRSIVIEDRNFFEPFSYVPPIGDPISGFFKKIIKGQITLYRYGDRLFAKKAGDDLREITKKQKKVNAATIAGDYSGLGFIRILVADCPLIDEHFLLDNYVNETGIKRIVNTYNGCFSEGSVDIQDIKVPSHLDLGLEGTLSEVQPNFSRTSLSDAHFRWSTSIGGGILLSLFTPAMGDNFRFVVEPTVGKYNGYCYFVSGKISNDLFIKYFFVRVPMVMRYFYKSIFFDVGVTNMVVMGNHTTWRQESSADNFIVTSSGPPYKINTGVIGLAGGVGVKTKIAGMPVLASVRLSNIFRSANDSAFDQPGVKWLDFNIALQLVHH